MNRRRLKKLIKNTDKYLFGTEMHISLGGIKGYKARLHRLVLSGNYKYDKIEKALGKLKIDNNFISAIRSPSYNKMAFRQFSGFYLNVFYSPKKTYYPGCTIEIHPKKDLPVQTYKDFLIELNEKLNKKLPGIKLSEVEYAIDVFCYDPEAVRNLQWLIRSCLYLPYQRNVITFDNDEIEINEKDIKISYLYGNNKEMAYDTGYKITEMNEVYRIGKYHKVYERGPDEKKKKDSLGWEIEDLDRVRMEYTANKIKLKEKGIFNLYDLIYNSTFKVLNESRWTFKQFERSAILPKLWQPYLEEQPPYFKVDKKNDNYQGFNGTFQLEHIRGAGKVDNIAQHRKPIDEMTPFERKLNEEICLFDKEWKQDTTTY
jgi:hypothetical protein